MKKAMTIFFLFGMAILASGQEISFTASIDTNTIVIGQQATYTLTAKNIRPVPCFTLSISLVFQARLNQT